MRIIYEVEQVATLYGNRQAIGAAILEECRAIVLQKFSHIGVNEIKEAYRAYACGEINAGGRGEMWGGEFNAANFTAILAAYCNDRRKVVAVLTNAQHEAETHRRNEERTERRKQEFEKNFASTLEGIAQKAESWQECPEYLFHSCESRGLINLTPTEKREIFARAIDIVKVQIQLKKNGAVTISEIRECISETSEDRARVIARQIALWECVVMKMKTELIT